MTTPAPLLGAQERALLTGDLKALTEAQRADLYARVCESLGLNPLTRPFDYLVLSGKLVLYARKDATDQLRALHGVSLEIVSSVIEDDLCVVTVRASMQSGRTDAEIGAVSIAGLRGEARANALMKAITKAKRRVTLSICGLGMLDETEAESIEGAVTYQPTTVRVEEKAPPHFTVDYLRKAFTYFGITLDDDVADHIEQEDIDSSVETLRGFKNLADGGTKATALHTWLMESYRPVAAEVPL